jgi:hypothetical protein
MTLLIEERISKERWVNLRGNLKQVYFNSKCNGPNGLSCDSTDIQSLESYQLDDLPAEGEIARGAARQAFAPPLEPF